MISLINLSFYVPPGVAEDALNTLELAKSFRRAGVEVMELIFLNGDDLYDPLKEEGKVPVRRALRVVSRVPSILSNRSLIELIFTSIS